MLRMCRWQLRNVYRYGVDIPRMAEQEQDMNIWAVRFCLLHILKSGLCFHPPHSMALHMGFSDDASNATESGIWRMDSLESCPEIPGKWPEPEENPALPALWRQACGARVSAWNRLKQSCRRGCTRIAYRWCVMWNPEGVYRVMLRRAIHEALLAEGGGTVHYALDYGCGSRPYDDLMSGVADTQVSVDIGTNPMADCRVSTSGHLPFADESMDLVTSFQVLEHVANPARYLAECARVCKPGGRLVISVPSVWPYHPHPEDFRRWVLPGLLRDLGSVGFVVREHWDVLNPVSAAMQYFLATVHYMLRDRGALARWCIRAFAFLLNAAILISEKCLGSTRKVGAGDYVVEARRVARNDT